LGSFINFVEQALAKILPHEPRELSQSFEADKKQQPP